MSEENIDDLPIRDAIAYPAVDWTLETLVTFANMGLGFGITFVVQGAVITGTLIGGAQYMEKMTAFIENGTSGRDSEGVGTSLAKLYAMSKANYERPQDDATDWSPPLDGYVHLENATMFNGPDTTNLGLWRGRMTEVAGYSFGALARA